MQILWFLSITPQVLFSCISLDYYSPLVTGTTCHQSALYNNRPTHGVLNFNMGSDILMGSSGGDFEKSFK